MFDPHNPAEGSTRYDDDDTAHGLAPGRLPVPASWLAADEAGAPADAPPPDPLPRSVAVAALSASERVIRAHLLRDAAGAFALGSVVNHQLRDLAGAYLDMEGDA